MNKRTAIMAALGAVAIITTASIVFSKKYNTSLDNHVEKLNNATEITVDERAKGNLPFAGKQYDVIVDDEVVAEVTGKKVPVWGDMFTLKTIDGEVLAYEKEDIRLNRLSINRKSDVYDANGNPIGSLKENQLKDFGKLKYIFHIKDQYGEKIGESRKFSNISFIQKFNIVDNQNNVDYKIDKKTILNPMKDRYVIEVKDPQSIIPLYEAIFLTCIEDAIGDAQASESSSTSAEEATKKKGNSSSYKK